MALIWLKEKELKEAGVVFTQGTLYKWHCLGEHAKLFVKLGKRLYLNLDEYNAWIKRSTIQSRARAKKLNKLKGCE